MFKEISSSTPSFGDAANGSKTSSQATVNRVLAGILGEVGEAHRQEVESLCKEALLLNGDRTAVLKYESKKKSVKKIQKKVPDIFSKLNSYTPNQPRNQAIRFDLEEASEVSLPRQSWGFKAFSNVPDSDANDYEDEIDIKVLEAPICDICIVQGNGDPPPKDFYRLYKTQTNKKANLNANSGGNVIYLCIKKDLTGNAVPITNLMVVFPDRGEHIPPGYFVVQRGKNACNLNTGTSADRIYLAYKKDMTGNPLIDIQVIFPAKYEQPPKGFELIDVSFTGLAANLNTGTSGLDTFVCYKQFLRRIECLQNDYVVDPDETNRNTRKNKSMEGLLQFLNEKDSANASRISDSDSVASSTNSKINVKRSDTNKRMNVMYDGDRLVHTDSMGDELEELLKDDDIDVDSQAGDVHGDHAQNNGRQTSVVVDFNGRLVPRLKRSSLYALLVALYIRRGLLYGSVLMGLLKLINETDFFSCDVDETFGARPLHKGVTMFDLTVEAVCDRFELSCEKHHDLVLQVLKSLMALSKGKLAFLTQMKMTKALFFLCANSSAKSEWVTEALLTPCDTSRNEPLNGYKMLRVLIWEILEAAETVDIAQTLPDTYEDIVDGSLYRSLKENYFARPNETEAEGIIACICQDFVEEIIDTIEIAKLSESSLLATSKQSLSISTTSFWSSLLIISKQMFIDPEPRAAFYMLCTVCKMAWHSVRRMNNGDPLPRDLGIKLIALDAINDFLTSAGEKLRVSKVFGYLVRRLVVPCLLYNSAYGLENSIIFSKMMHVVTALWKNWRSHIRIEFAIICEELIMKILHARTQINPVFQLHIIQEVIVWFDQPHMLVEMFVNYDMDRKFVSHWNIFSYLVRAVCAIGRQIVTVMANPRASVITIEDKRSSNTCTLKDVHFQALEEVAHMAKTLMDASGHAYLIIQDESFRSRSLAVGWQEDDETGSRYPGSPSRQNSSSNDGTEFKSSSKKSLKRVGSIKFRRAAHLESERVIKDAIKIYEEKKSLKKAVEFLISKNFMSDTPQEIANFLRVYKSSFDPASIGDFLGEGGVTPAKQQYWSQIRFRYTRAVSFVEMDLEPALRLYLTGCGFRLPGEAQKIDRLIEVFVKAFWQDNSGTKHCPFSTEDAVFLVAFATIMLNTDLHRANSDKKTKRKKMTKEEFINNLRGADRDKNVDRDYLSRIYDNVEASPIEMDVQVSEMNAFRDRDETKLPELSTPMTESTRPVSTERRIAEEKAYILKICRNLRDSEDLLRSLSTYTHRFQLTGVDTNISLDLVTFMYESVWFHFHAVAETLLNSPNSDMNVRFIALDILVYSMTSAIFLDLKVEKMTFATLLSKFRTTCEAEYDYSALNNMNNLAHDVPDNSWYDEVEEANPESTMETIAKVHKLMVYIKDSVQQSTNYELTRQVAATFEKKARILEKNTFFVRQAELTKLKRSSGRPTTYTFFLFSDELIYAHLGGISHQEYKVHGQLALDAMEISDVVDDTTRCSFYIGHPVKSFVVVTSSPSEKQSWIRDLSQAISSCKKRIKAEVTAAESGSMRRHMSIIGRIEDQQMVQMKEAETIRSAYSTPDAVRLPGSTSNSRRNTPSYRLSGGYGSIAGILSPEGTLNIPSFFLPSQSSLDEDERTNELDAASNSIHSPSSSSIISTDSTDYIPVHKRTLSESVSIATTAPITNTSTPVVSTEEKAAMAQEDYEVFVDTLKDLTDAQIHNLYFAVSSYPLLGLVLSCN